VPAGCCLQDHAALGTWQAVAVVGLELDVDDWLLLMKMQTSEGKFYQTVWKASEERLAVEKFWLVPEIDPKRQEWCAWKLHHWWLELPMCYRPRCKTRLASSLLQMPELWKLEKRLSWPPDLLLLD
jgi:hypothetical protein